jgi:hypothetical protein
MQSHERIVAFEAGRVVLVGEFGMGRYLLTAGDVVELSLQGHFQPVRVESGGYRGWYYVMADGQRGRFAVGMRARLTSRSFGLS